MVEIRRVFQVAGKPFFPLGGQARNSSGYNADEARRAFEVVRALHGNTLEIPVYWEQVEPAEGQYDWASVDSLLAQAAEFDVRLVLLWFATWKNGCMAYAPAWVKRDPARFRRVISPLGKAIRVLSSHCAETLEAERRTFAALCRHLREVDGDAGRVIAIQVENEPGILGAARDYGPDGARDYRAPVPADLLAAMARAGRGTVYDAWQRAGGRAGGTWAEVFGNDAAEFLSAYSIARFIDRVAETGKAEYPLPMYVNVWLGEVEWSIPGDSYPSGGAVTRVLDIYRWVAPHIDLIAPDIYIQDPFTYRAVCQAYSRPDNPLFVPESATGGTNAWNLFRAIADHNAIGYACFGIERMMDETGAIRPEHAEAADSFRAAAAAIPLILRYQGTGRLHAVAQDEGMGYYRLDLEGYVGLVTFGDGAFTAVNKDWRHPTHRPFAGPERGAQRGRGLVIQASEREFYVVGAGFVLNLRKKTTPEEALDMTNTRPWALPRLSPYESVEEGYLTAEGAFVATRRRNGDETDFGIWAEADTGVVRVVLND